MLSNRGRTGTFIFGAFSDFHADLGGQHDPVATIGQGLAQDFLRHPAGRAYLASVALIHVGGIYEIDALIKRPMSQLDGVCLTDRCTEGHCAQTKS